MMYLEVDLYEKAQPLDSVIHFLTVTLKELGWNNGKDDLVMDVGCGPGNVTVKWILPIFPNLKKMIAMDYLPSMIKAATTRNYHPKIEYHTANFEDESTVERWKGQISKLTSILSFHWFKDQAKSFQIIYDLLQPGGEAACYFILGSDYYDAVLEIANDQKWKSFFEKSDICTPESYYKKYDSSHYRKLAEGIGFKVVLCRCEFKINKLPSHKEAKDLFYSICPLVPHVPENERNIFKDELYQSVLKNGGRSEDGTPLHRASTIEIVIKKPD
ncbi:methyltransf_25 domain-containing protein [Nephila pilipes]|uniref:Methyltransf_25 domain-containing protein n=1 Tax=Nephila pilipes TaxID=299642 RepID=A0A8X6NVI9_NEPPI|nr:methyltransf_25 domain-containing protein [Nephila pilipes]